METNPEYNPAYRTDGEIAEDVLDQLTADSRVDEIDINIKVKKGVVTLSGQAESAEEAEMTESLVQRVEGVIDVVNRIFVVRSGGTENPWPGRDAEQESELEDIEVIPGEREATENYIEAVDEGLSYIPPDAPEFPTERDGAFELRRREVAEQRSKSRRRTRKHETDKVEGQEL